MNLLPIMCLASWTLNDLFVLIIAAVSIQFYIENIKKREFNPEIFTEAHTASAIEVTRSIIKYQTWQKPMGSIF